MIIVVEISLHPLRLHIKRVPTISEPQPAEPAPAPAELRRGWRGGPAGPAAPRLGDGQGAQRSDLLHEPYQQDHPVGGSEKGKCPIFRSGAPL